MSARPRDERSPKRPKAGFGRFLLPVAAVGTLSLTVGLALVMAGGMAGPDPAGGASPPARATAGRAPVVSSSGAKDPVVVASGVKLTAADIAAAARVGSAPQVVNPSPDLLAPGTPERAAADFAAALAGGGLNDALARGDAAGLADLKVTGADVGAARVRGSDRADVPLRLSYDGTAGPASTAVDAALNRDASGAWQVDASGVARDLSTSSAAPTPIAAAKSAPPAPTAQPSDPQAAAALAALGQAMRGSPGAATPVDRPIASAGLGLNQREWEDQHNRRAAGGWFAVQYRDGAISRLEKTMGADSRLILEDARKEARMLAPDDAASVGRATAGGDPIDLYTSASLASRFRDPAAKPGEPPRFHVRYRVSGDRVVSYALALGAP